MNFEEILDQAIALLQRRERLTYRALKRQFDLDDAFLDDLKEELIYGQQLAVDEDGKVLVWTGAIGTVSTTSPAADFAPATTTQRAPLSYTPSHLTEKILDARPRLEGERKQVTVLFADIKDSTDTWAPSIGLRVTIGRRSRVSVRPWRRSREHNAVSGSVRSICRLYNHWPSLPPVRRNWAYLLRVVRSVKKVCRLLRLLPTPAA